MKRWIAFGMGVMLLLFMGTSAFADTNGAAAFIWEFTHKRINDYTVWRACVKEINEDKVTFRYTSAVEWEGTQRREVEEEVSASRTSWNEALEAEDEVRLYLSPDRDEVYYACDVASGQALEEKLQFLLAFDIVNGYEDGAYHLDRGMTRAEFAALLARAYYPGETMQASELPFVDMEGMSWAENAIGVLYEKGVIHGISDTQFAPDDAVTYGQMAAMAVRSVGLQRMAESEGGYPDGYCRIAQKARITAEEKSPEEFAKRSDMVEVLYATFDHQLQMIPSSMGWGAKPVIYLYPEKEQEVDVKLELDGQFTFTYPAYQDGWHVTAKPDGTILSAGREYSYLFWEGIMPNMPEDFSKGFVVSREDTVSFLQEALEKMGLTPREYNEFIVYWAPRLEKNAYNKIYFAGEEYDNAAKLTISPQPDSLLRIYMMYEPAEKGESLPPQEIKPFERNGFTVVEWGGRELR